MGYRDAQWYSKDTWIGFSKNNIAKQAVACHTLWLLKSWAAWMAKLLSVAYKPLVEKLLKSHRHVSDALGIPK